MSDFKAFSSAPKVLWGVLKKSFIGLVRFIGATFGEVHSGKRIEFLTMVVTIFAVGAGIAGAVLIYRQIVDLRAGLDSQAYGLVAQGFADLNKQLIAHPELRPYFYARLDQYPDDNKKTEPMTLALADMYLDAMDHFYSQSPHIDWSHNRAAEWEIFFKRSFGRSKILCFVLCKEQDEYADEIRELAENICTGVTRREKSAEKRDRRSPAPTPKSDAACRQP